MMDNPPNKRSAETHQLIPPHCDFPKLQSQQTNYLLDQRLQALKKTFLKDYGFIERLYRTRILTNNQSRR